MGKKIFYITIIFYLLSVSTTLAHPGDTDSNGGHTCRTNCENWGLNYGEYHYNDSAPISTSNDYNEGYDQGYELAYNYTSECELDYDWWWEGPQAFGDGYEQGIKDGHQEGLLLCYEDSTQAGYDKGYSDYIDDYEYDAEIDGAYDVSSFEKGYVDGWAEAKSEDDSEVTESASYDFTDDSSTDSDDTSTNEEKISVDKTLLFDDGYDEGFQDAINDYLYEDFKSELNEKELKIYKKGYFAGYVEGGGGGIKEILYYYLLQKFLYIMIVAGTIIIISLVWFISKRIRSKNTSDSVDNKPKVKKDNRAAWIISGVIITTIVGVCIYSNTSETEPVISDQSDNDNHYEDTSVDHDCSDFDTQEDAQLFYEANGGPYEDPHDLDRDNDGMACDWNP